MNSSFLKWLLVLVCTLSACRGGEGDSNGSISSAVQSQTENTPLIPPGLVISTDTLYQEDGTHFFTYSFTNTTESVLTIAEVKSGGAMAPSWSKEAIAPGHCGWVGGTMDLRAHPGDFNKSLTLTLNGDKEAQAAHYTVLFKGYVSADPRPATRTGDIFPAAFLFDKGKFWQAHFRIPNEGQHPLLLKSMETDAPGWELTLVTDTLCGVPMNLGLIEPGKVGWLRARISKEDMANKQPAKMEVKIRVKANAAFPPLRVRKMPQPD